MRTDNYFCEVAGIADEADYNDTLALFNHKIKENPALGMVFNGTIPKPNSPELISSITSELLNMKLGHFVNEDIHLTASNELNATIRQALDVVVLLALQNETFVSPTIRNNFIAKLMIWANTYLEPLSFSEMPPKCLYYGTLKRHEAYFLIFLALVGVDVIYFNPTGDTTLKAVDTQNLSQLVQLGSAPSILMPLEERLKKGVVIEKVTTYAKQATNELANTLYTSDSGIYKPWQFANGTTRPVIMDSVIEDTLTYWDEEARMRPGFKVTGQTVHVPIFFSKINGVYKDLNEYYRFIDKLKSAKKYCFFETTRLTAHLNYTQTNAINFHNVSSNNMGSADNSFNQKDLYSLAYCLNPDKTINRDAVKGHVLYKKLLTFRLELQEFILNKLEETFSPNNQGFFNFDITDKERVRLMACIFTAEDKLLNLIDGFDFTSYIPKVIMYINSRETFNTDDAMFIGFLRFIGLDFVLLCPNGANNLEMIISPKFITEIQLEDFVYDLPLKAASSKKNSFFGKLFR